MSKSEQDVAHLGQLGRQPLQISQQFDREMTLIYARTWCESHAEVLLRPPQPPLDQHREILVTRKREFATRVAIPVDEGARDLAVAPTILAPFREHESESGDLMQWHHRPGGVPVDKHETAPLVEAHQIGGMEIAVAANHPLNQRDCR